MKLCSKQYKHIKLKKILRKAPIIIICHTTTMKIKSWRYLEQNLTNLKLDYHRVSNQLFKKIIKKSIFKNTNSIFYGPSFLIKLSKVNWQKTLMFQDLININPLLTPFCIRYNNNVYLQIQLKKFKLLNYINSVCFFKKILQLLLSKPSIRFF